MKRIIITGTSRGIGKQLAEQLAQQGHEVIALSRSSNPGSTFTTLDMDFTDESQYAQLDAVLAKGPIDVVIHNAGALINKPFEELTTSDFEYVYKVNVFGLASLTRKLIPSLTKGAHVVTISSMGGIQGSSKFPGLAAYSSSKGAVITLSELLAEEYKERGISFNVLALGAVQTEMLGEAFPGYIAPLSATEMAAYIGDFALNAHKYYNGKVLQVACTTP